MKKWIAIGLLLPLAAEAKRPGGLNDELLYIYLIFIGVMAAVIGGDCLLKYYRKKSFSAYGDDRSQHA